MGVDPLSVGCLVRNADDLSDPKPREIMKFALKCSRHRERLAEVDYTSLRQHSDILKVIAMSACAVYANMTADMTRMEPDEMFDTV